MVRFFICLLSSVSVRFRLFSNFFSKNSGILMYFAPFLYCKNQNYEYNVEKQKIQGEY